MYCHHSFLSYTYQGGNNINKFNGWLASANIIVCSFIGSKVFFYWFHTHIGILKYILLHLWIAYIVWNKCFKFLKLFLSSSNSCSLFFSSFTTPLSPPSSSSPSYSSSSSIFALSLKSFFNISEVFSLPFLFSLQWTFCHLQNILKYISQCR